MPETTSNQALQTLPPLTYRGAALFCVDANLLDVLSVWIPPAVLLRLPARVAAADDTKQQGE